MAGFDIKKLIAAVEDIAYGEEVNEKANKRIDTEKEQSIFLEELNNEVKHNDLTQEDANQLFGLYTQQAAPNKDYTNFALSAIKELSFDVITDAAALTKELSSTFEKNKATQNGAVYNLLEDAISNIATLFSAKEFNSKDDIDNIENELKAEIKKDKTDPLKDFKLDVLEILIDKAEQVQKQKEFNEVKARYNELRNPEKEGEKPLSRSEAYKKTKKEFWNKGSYYRHIAAKIERDIVYPETVAQVQGAIDNQKGKENITSWSQVKDAVEAELGEDYDKYAREVLRRGGDKSRTFKEQFGNLDPSTTKALGKKVASQNRQSNAQQNGLTEEELNDIFGTHFWHGNWKNNHEAIQKLISAGLIEPMKDDEDKIIPGKYNITPLINKIGLYAGGNEAVDRQPKEYIPYDEMYNYITDILTEGNLTATKIRKADAIALAKACGYDYNGDGFFKKLYQNTVGGVLGTVGSIFPSAAAELSADSIDIPFKINMNGAINITIDLSRCDGNIDWGKTYINLVGQKVFSFTDLNGVEHVIELAEGDIKLSDNNVLAITKDFSELLGEGFDVEDLEEYGVGVDIKKSIATGIGIAVAMMILKAALEDGKSELPVTVTQFDNTMTYEKYCKELDLKAKDNNDPMTPQIAAALKALAHAYIQIDDDGNPILNKDNTVKWNKEGFKQLLNGRHIAGNKSMPNKYEVNLGARDLLKNEAKLVEEAQIKDEPCDEVDALKKENKQLKEKLRQTNEGQQPTQKGKLRTRPTSYKTQTEDGSHTGWKELANAYDKCFNKYFESNPIPVLKYKGKDTRSKELAKTRIIKLMQGIKDGNFSAARINELLEMVYKMEHNQTYTVPEYFDIDAYNSALNGAPGKETAMPDPILYDENVPEYALSEQQKEDYCKRGTFENVTYTSTGSVSSATRGNYSESGTIYEVDEKGDGNWKQISKKDYETKSNQKDKYDIP